MGGSADNSRLRRPQERSVMQSSEVWYVKFFSIDFTPPRDAQSRRMQSRDSAESHARELERLGYTVRSIVGPTGETPWEQIK
jgi:hypothetical protein